MGKNIIAYSKKIAKMVGDYHQTCWEEQLTGHLLDGIDSPIEQLFFMALLGIVECSPPLNDKVFILSQFKIGTYIVDFLVFYRDTGHEGPRIVVECDGHEFHDKNEKQRRYEKKRDRYLTSAGYKVLHYTGKEITDDPMSAAKEVLMAATSGTPWE